MRDHIGAFIPTSHIWDVSELYTTEVTSPAFKELLVRLYQNLNRMAMSVNIRDAGMYTTDEFVCGQTYPPNAVSSSATTTKPLQRQVFRKMVTFGALPNAAVKNVAHGITVTPTTTFTRIYAAASNPALGNFVPIPYASLVAADIIELSVDGTNVTIETGADWSAYTTCYVVLEYIKT